MLRKVSLLLLSLLVLIPALSACSNDDPLVDAAPRENILLWHTWTGAEAAVLNGFLAKYQATNPDKLVTAVAVPTGELVARLQDRTDAGLGPDLILADGELADELVANGLVRDLGGVEEIDQEVYLVSALKGFRDEGRLYGLPFSIDTHLLFYNPSLVSTPAKNLDELKAQANAGQTVAMNTRFEDAYWGAQLFGGEPFNADGSLALDEGGLVHWLNALRGLEATPGFRLSDDPEQLYDAFVSGDAAYYVGRARELPALQAAMGAGAVGAAMLPGLTAQRPAGPILYADALFVSSAAAPQEAAAAIDLANFLTNYQQQTQLATVALGRLPANVQVRYDTSSPAAVLELARQSRTATAIPFDLRPVWESIAAAGDPLNFRVLEGVLPASEGILQLADTIAAQYGLVIPELSGDELCPKVGPQSLTLWHAWTESETAALVEIVDEFEALCPGITIELQAQDPNKQRERYTAAVEAGGGPDIQLESTQWSILLAQQGLLRDLTEEINQEWLEPLLPTAVAAMRYNQRLYGFPESVKSLGLFYNADLVEDPPLTLEDLLFQVDAEHRFAMPILYFYGYWGMTAFGGGLYDASGAVIPDNGGLEQWLAWLSEAKRRPGMLFTDSRRTAEEAFAAGRAAYFVSGPWSLANLQEQLGAKLRVAPLPAGPQGPGRPLLEVESVLFNPAISDGKLAAGLAFARYLTGKASQERLLATGQHISANIKVDLRDYPILQMFRYQANLAAVVYEGEEWLPIDAAGSAAYDTVLNQGADPVDAVADYNAVVKRYSGQK